MLGEPGRWRQRGTAILRCPFVLYAVRSGRFRAHPAVTIDLNADVGEAFGAFTIGDDAELMRSITSANVAAGFHGGDPSVLRRTIRLAKSHGVAVGAHPGFPDLAGFGRREMRLAPQEVEDLVLIRSLPLPVWLAPKAFRCSTSRPMARCSTWRPPTVSLPSRSFEP